MGCIRNGLMAALAAVSLVLPAQAQTPQKTLKAVVHADLKIMDPVWTTAYITLRHSYVVYDTLFALDSKFVPRPQMVQSWSVSPDQLTWTFVLRPGLVFHDGAPVRSDDVVPSITRWMARDVMGQMLASFTASVDKVDDKTFRIVLKEPYGLVMESLGKASTPPFIMPERIARTSPNEQVTDPTGSGPFMFRKEEWRPGNKVVYVKHQGYVPRAEPPEYLSGGKVVKLDRLEWLYIPDNNTTLSALTTGEIDYFEAPPLDFIKPMQANPDLRVLNIDNLGVQGLIRPNSLYPPFNSYKGRQALLHIIDQEDFMAAVVGNPDLAMTFCGAYFLCHSENETDVGSAPLRKPDYAKAKALLAEAGYKGEKIVVLLPTDRPQYNAATTVLIDSLRKAGVNVDAQAADWSTITARRARKDPPDKGGYNLFITTHGGPDVTLPISNVWFNSKCDKANPGWACDPELEALVSQWAREGDRDRRHALIDKVQLRAYESVPYVPFGQFFQPVAFRKNITGVLPAGIPVYWNIDKQ